MPPPPQDCAALRAPDLAPLGAGVAWTGQVCEAELRSLQGQADDAASTLRALARSAPPEQSAWLSLVRAELAERRQDPEAGTLFQAASVQLGDVYSLGAYADWLLAHGQAAEAVRLLAGREDADALLLRLTLAYRQTADARLDDATRQLEARFADALARGDTSHARERARFALTVRGDAPAALTLAQQNWTAQKEPADARLLIAAAQAAGRPEAARDAMEAARRWAGTRMAGPALQVSQASPSPARHPHQER